MIPVPIAMPFPSIRASADWNSASHVLIGSASFGTARISMSRSAHQPPLAIFRVIFFISLDFVPAGNWIVDVVTSSGRQPSSYLFSR